MKIDYYDQQRSWPPKIHFIRRMPAIQWAKLKMYTFSFYGQTENKIKVISTYFKISLYFDQCRSQLSDLIQKSMHCIWEWDCKKNNLNSNDVCKIYFKISVIHFFSKSTLIKTQIKDHKINEVNSSPHSRIIFKNIYFITLHQYFYITNTSSCMYD